MRPLHAWRTDRLGRTTLTNRRRLLPAASAVLLVVALLFFLRESILLLAGDYLVIRDELRPADLIHVIAGPDYRADHAAALYLRGYAPVVFFTGGWCVDEHYYHGAHGRQRAVQMGVPARAVASDDSRVTSTYQEVLRLKEFIAQSPVPIRSVIVVSDPHHMRRARWTYHQILGSGIAVQMAPVPFESSPYRRRWWTEAASRRMVFDEYLKIVYYHARYQLSRGPVTDWLASFDRE